MNIEELKKRLINGEEFVFYFNHEEYWIGRTIDCFYLSRVKDSNVQEYKDVEDLINKATIENRIFSDVFPEIDL
ncbi:hypothetical protein [Bacillus sp. FJAT-27445]|uniref:hypothetical protein n=1 Tax=Bacillus sp. FJAT-27445 TaxID=1679166 RepID=UPI0007440DDB|nr:hypothetical protein [Bacillus sp. FJAT-27445]